MSVPKELKYTCVHCGVPVLELYKQYSPSVLKLTNCSNCQNVADKYVEYDNVIIIIDVILFSKQAYRHFLYNSNFQNHWKLALLLLLIKSFDELTSIKLTSNKEFSHQSEILTEQKFYFSCFITTVGKFHFLLMVQILLTVYSVFYEKKIPSFDYNRIIWKALVTSSFGHFLLLPSLIWSDFHREIHLIFINAYIFLSQIQALSVVCQVKVLVLAGILALGAVTDYGASSYLRSTMWVFLV